MGHSPSKSKVIVRLAKTFDDLNLCHPLSLEMHLESRVANIPYSHEKCDQLFKKALDHPNHYALMIAEDENDQIGFIMCSAGEYIVGHETLMTTVYGFYIRQQYRGSMNGGRAAISLISSLKKWSQNRNVSEILLHVTSGMNITRTHKFLTRVGFNTIGGNYAFSL